MTRFILFLSMVASCQLQAQVWPSSPAATTTFFDPEREPIAVRSDSSVQLIVSEYLLAKAAYEKYRFSVDFLEGFGLPCNVWDWMCCSPFCSMWNGRYWWLKARRDAWGDGYYWLNNSNNRYKGIIGALTTTWVNSYQCACNGYTFPTNQPSCPPGCTLSSNGGYWSVVTKPSDGVALAESAMAYPGAQTEPLLGSNHQQMRNDSNTKAKMLKLLSGGFGDYFATQVR